MSVVIVVLYETDSLRAAELRWPLRLAALRGGDIMFLVAATGDRARSRSVDLIEGPETDPSRLAFSDSLRELLDQELTPEGWMASGTRAPDGGAAAGPGDDARIRVALRLVPTAEIPSVAQPLVADARRDLLVTVVEAWQREETEWRGIARRLLQESTCEVCFVIPGRRQAHGEVLFQTGHGRLAGDAAPLAWRLAQRYERKATGLWVEAPIGPDSERAGRQLLERALAGELGEDASQVLRRVEVVDPPERGFLRACGDERFEVLVMGTSRPGAAGLAEVRLPMRVARGTDQPTLVAVRSAMPAQTRVRRFLEFHLRRVVPQLERQERSSFVANVQSSSQWNFDFIALMGLASSIATLGLIADSAAVIIGAMLVAPLMTPLMGIGLSIIQGNLRLAGTTARTAFQGFLLAFGLAFVIGSLDPEFGTATGEMHARHWPGLVDLSVAFVAGLAAAYASGRPGLLAALPGVAIAASLVPPITTSGLAVSIGNADLALGAILLFWVNVVAIVLATALVLWAVGLRSGRPRKLRERVLGLTVLSIAIVTTAGLALSPPIAAPPLALVREVEALLSEEHRLRLVRLRHEGRPVLQIDVGGSLHQHPVPGPELRAIAREYLGEDAVVRLTYRHEALLD